MISFTSAQLSSWLALLLFPLARVGGLVATAPIFSSTAIPNQISLILALTISMALAPVLPPMPEIPPGSWLGVIILFQQLLIGVLLGFVVRIAFMAVNLAGNLIGLQMGLSFAVFYDPQGSAQTPVVAEFLGLLASLLFLAMNGHLLMLSILAESFNLLPISTTPFAAKGIGVFLGWAGTLFSTGVLLSLPLVAALLIANIAMGVLSRVAPQLNLFAIGFPVTLGAGLVVLMVSMPYFGNALEQLFSQAFAAMRNVIDAGGAIPLS